ncbi:YrzA family protein [Bacillus tianshenii]|nr:YrzA family protein [Bacillus tianshenii]
MQIKLDRIEDKIEFFEAGTLKELEKKVNEKVEQNQAILLQVHSVSHQSHVDYESGRTYFTAVVHFKAK